MYGSDLDSAARTVFEWCLAERQSLSSQAIISQVTGDDLEVIQPSIIPKAEPRLLQDVLADSSLIFSRRVRLDHPQFLGLIPSPVNSVAWLAGLLEQTHNVNCGSWYLSSGPSAIEKGLIDWMTRDLIGFSDDKSEPGGCFSSGGTMTNLQAMMAARDAKLPCVDDRQRGIIYMSGQTHQCIPKGLKVLGFSESQIRKIDCDDNFKIDIGKLQQAIAADKDDGKIPFLLVANIGTTNTGAVDDLTSLAKIASDANLWFHADGAYGASALLCKSRRHLLQGIEHLDSIAWDAHKWLFQTYSCSIVLVRDKKTLFNSFYTSAEYIEVARESTVEFPNFWNYGIELTRPARAMKLWFTLQVEGLQKISDDLEHGFLLAETAERALLALRCKGWELTNAAQMGIVCFRYAPLHGNLDDRQVNDLNKKISLVAINENIATPTTTELRGKTVLRMCPIHPHLTEDDIWRIFDDLHRIACSLIEEVLIHEASTTKSMPCELA